MKLRHSCLVKFKFAKVWQKKMERLNKITSIVDTGLITSTVITERVSIAGFASGVGQSVGIALSGTSLIFSV